MANHQIWTIHGIGEVSPAHGFTQMQQCSDGFHEIGKNGVISILTPGDRKVEFINFQDRSLAFVNSAMGYPAYYPVHPLKVEKPLKAILMDLDGTTVRSEEFWIWIIQESISTLMGDPTFELEEADIPFVSGHSVSEHLKYCLLKYCPDKTVEEARTHYFRHTHEQLDLIIQGKGRKNAFTPTEGIRDFLLEIKSLGIRIGLVTSGLYEKAWPEILDAFRTLGMGDPSEFYDAIITAGFPLRKGSAGTLGELSPKPHPWLYAETARVGLGIPFDERYSVVGIEDSGAGISSIVLAGFSALGISGGNIEESGTQDLCHKYARNFEEILDWVRSA